MNFFKNMEIVKAFNHFKNVNEKNIDLQFIKKYCRENHIKYKYEDENFNRFLFYTKTGGVYNKSETFYANGMICEFYDDKWNISCFPFPNVSNIKFLDKNIEYMVYPLYESTIVNVYFSVLLNKWCFGTRKSFDLYNSTWRGINYSDVFKDIDTENLDKNTTYIYSVSNEFLHLFCHQNRTTLIGMVRKNENDFEVECLDDIEISVEEAQKNAAESLKNYLISKDNSTANFGYIFRSQNSFIICESELLKKINSMFYKPPYIPDKLERKDIYQKYANINYIIAKCYVKDYKYSSIMVPWFVGHFKLINLAEQELINYLTKKFEKKNIPFKFNNNITITYAPPKSILSEEFESFILRNNHKINSLLNRNIKVNKLMKDFVYENKNIDFIANLLEFHYDKLTQLANN